MFTNTPEFQSLIQGMLSQNNPGVSPVLDIDDTLSEFVLLPQKKEMQKRITNEYPGIFEAKDTFESKELRDAITQIQEGDFNQVSSGVNLFNSAMNDGLMETFGLPVLSEQDKFTLAMLRGKV